VLICSPWTRSKHGDDESAYPLFRRWERLLFAVHGIQKNILLNAFAFFHLREKNMRHIFAGVTETQTPIHAGRRR
ncbi:hypothetical protein, partial [Bacteroides heparinolyticus]|uniref:hypothetical protein n=1 Tax=Prevotella heparinolytica TaxID=28113 RepID=UPI0035A0CA24